ncbi:hypothetical protein L1049_028244 [Liquidambar formosana]|uniref:Uncharacterized protein n=1 Tax=Liquidambar formosana TaxID=63359 RepID=A0AAP0RJC3_LIQFO
MRLRKSEPILGASPKSKCILDACPESEPILSQTNLGQKRESDSIDLFESSKCVKDSVFSSSSVEAPSHSFSVIGCINFLKTMGLDEDFYVKAVGWLTKSVDNRQGFLGLEAEFREALLRLNI